jgi:hypothetical protein
MKNARMMATGPPKPRTKKKSPYRSARPIVGSEMNKMKKTTEFEVVTVAAVLQTAQLLEDENPEGERQNDSSPTDVDASPLKQSKAGGN